MLTRAVQGRGERAKDAGSHHVLPKATVHRASVVTLSVVAVSDAQMRTTRANIARELAENGYAHAVAPTSVVDQGSLVRGTCDCSE